MSADAFNVLLAVKHSFPVNARVKIIKPVTHDRRERKAYHESHISNINRHAGKWSSSYQLDGDSSVWRKLVALMMLSACDVCSGSASRCTVTHLHI